MAITRARALRWLIPQPEESGRILALRTQVRLSISLVFANLIGAAVVFAIGFWVLPFDQNNQSGASLVANLVVIGIFFVIVTPLATKTGGRRLREAGSWLLEDREPTPAERIEALRMPRRIVSMHIRIWLTAAIVFGALNAYDSFEAGQRVAVTIIAGGLTTCAFVYLLAERQLRPIAARALASGLGDKRVGPGVKTRAFAAWALGTAVPIVGLMTIALSALIEADFSRDDLAIVILSIGGAGLIAGLFASLLSARAVADPVNSLRKAVSSVEDGDLDVSVPVYDGSEIGQLQAGFNSMVSGLRERERLQDLFGRHVGEEVARKAVEDDVELGGEVREVAVLFTDIIGSTKLAAERPPEQVVELLNQFFGVVVEVVGSHGGWVNKFEGDAALAIFGAPTDLDDAPTRALAAARELAERLPREVPDLEAAIGVSAGEAVAGNIGDEKRFEYTVIGDPVNEAARLTELAKEKPGRLLASGAILERANGDEERHWSLDGAKRLRGRSEETRLATPVDSAG